MSWTRLSLVTDAEVGALEPEATRSDAPWGKITWDGARAEAKRDLKVWLEADFAEIPGVTDRIIDRWAPDWIWGYTASAYTDYTSAGSDRTEDDITLSTVFATPASDALYVGAAYEFSGLFLKLLSAVSATASTMSVAYWNGAAWTTLTNLKHTYVDGTASGTASLAVSGRVTWIVPPDWERRSLNGTDTHFYWVRVMVSATLTSGTKAVQVLPIRLPDGLKRVAAYLSCHHIFQGLSAQASEPEYWRTRATDYWQKAETLYARMREKGGIPLDVNQDQVIDAPDETTQIRSVVLRRG